MCSNSSSGNYGLNKQHGKWTQAIKKKTNENVELDLTIWIDLSISRPVQVAMGIRDGHH